MDPISLTVATNTLLGLCLTVSKSIIAYVKSVRNPDKSIKHLLIEIDTLYSTLNSLSDKLNDPLWEIVVRSGARHDGEYWKCIGISMRYCKQTIDDLSDVINKVVGVEGGFVARMIRPIRLGLKTEEITTYRQQIISYREAIGFALQWISV
jgi:hypothetical protein